MAWIIRTLSWHRRKMAALFTALGMFALLAHLSGAPGTPGQGTDVVVITAPVAAGNAITAADVSVRQLPRSAVPAGAVTSLDEAVGRSAAVSLPGNAVLHPGLLVAGAPAADGRALVPVTVPDAQLREILSPGVRIALVAPGPDAAGILTDDVVVHALPRTAEPSFTSSRQTALVLVDVPAALAPEVAMLGQSGQLSVFLTG